MHAVAEGQVLALGAGEVEDARVVPVLLLVPADRTVGRMMASPLGIVTPAISTSSNG